MSARRRLRAGEFLNVKDEETTPLTLFNRRLTARPGRATPAPIIPPSRIWAGVALYAESIRSDRNGSRGIGSAPGCQVEGREDRVEGVEVGVGDDLDLDQYHELPIWRVRLEND
jgi:hypothetical protein